MKLNKLTDAIKPPNSMIQSQSKYWPQYLAVVSASLGFFNRGLHSAWTSPNLPKLLNETTWTPPFYINNIEASWIVGSYFLGVALAGPISAILANRLGRKNTIVLSAIPHIGCFMLFAIATSAEYIYVGRVLAGMNEAIVNIAVPVYVGEVAHPKIRGVLGSVISVASIAGLLLINIIGSYTSIWCTSLICSIFGLMLLLIFSWMPETPYYLLMKNRENDARRALQTLRASNVVDDELHSIKISVEKQMLNVGSFRDIFCIGSNRRALIAAMGMEIVQQCSGISAIQSYTQIIFLTSGQEISSQMSSIIIMSVQLVMSIFATTFVDCVGRKPLLLFSSAGCGLALVLEGVYFYLQNVGYTHLDDINWLPLTALIMYIAIYSTGLAIILNVLLGEIFASNVKGKAMAMNIILYGLISFFVSKFFQDLSDAFGMYMPFFMYALCCFVGFFFIYFFIPETKGKTLQDIQEWFMQK